MAGAPSFKSLGGGGGGGGGHAIVTLGFLRIYCLYDFFNFPYLYMTKIKTRKGPIHICFYFQNAWVYCMLEATTEAEAFLRCVDEATSSWLFNTLRPRQNGRHFADDIFKCIFLTEKARISLKISLKFVPKVRINTIPALVQIMAWRRPGDKPLSEPMMVSLLTHICVTRPQLFKSSLAAMLTRLRLVCHINHAKKHTYRVKDV